MSKLSIVLALIFLTTLGTLLALNTVYSSNPVLTALPAIFPTKTVTSENTLTIIPATAYSTAGKPVTLEVTIDSFGEAPSLVQMELAYDPSVLGTVRITPGTFFEDPQVALNTVNERIGRISYAITSGSGGGGKTTSKTVATIRVTPRVTSLKRQTTLSFLPKTVVRTESGKKVLKTAKGTTITITNLTLPQASPSVQVSP